MRFFSLSILLISSGFTFAQFSEQQIISVAIPEPYMAIPYDVNEDGHYDIITASRDRSDLMVLINRGDNSFDSPVVLNNKPSYYEKLKFADLNKDEREDIIFLRLNPREIVWMERTTSSNFFAPEEVLLTSTPFYFMDFLLFDLDEDGHTDIIALESNTHISRINWYRNKGDLSFENAKRLIDYPDQILKFVLEDIDDDGKEDLLAVDDSGNPTRIFWHKNLGDGFFGEEQLIHVFNYFHSDFTSALDFQVADINADGKNDIILSTYNEIIGDRLFRLDKLDNKGTYTDPIVIDTESSMFLVSDLTLNGDPDLLLWNLFGNKISWKQNISGEFGNSQLLTSQVIHPYYVATADMDNDGFPDVISTSMGDNKIAWYKNEILHKEVISSQKFQLYPNPTDGLVFLPSDNSIRKIEVYNVFGIQVSIPSDDHIVNLSSLPPGIYLLHIISESNRRIQKIVKK